MAYQLKVKEWTGPLDALLSLIEARKMEITEISLAAVTDDFLKYLEDFKNQNHESGSLNPTEYLRILSDFVVVASRLIFIKSKSLLPDMTLTEEDEADIKDLEIRLQIYKELRPAMRLLAKQWASHHTTFSRPYLLNTANFLVQPEGKRVFYPSPTITPENFALSLDKIFALFKKFSIENEVVREKIMSLEEKIQEVIERFREFEESRFHVMSKDKSRGEVIITFLAILHLAREQLIIIEQDGYLSDIIIKKSNPI